MKKVIALVLLATMMMTLCAPALAWTESWVINPKAGGTFKKSPTNHSMPDSGSFWRATYVSGTWEESEAYVYKSGHGQVSSNEPISRGQARRSLEYLEPKVIGDTYWIVVSNQYGSTVQYDYYF